MPSIHACIAESILHFPPSVSETFNACHTTCVSQAKRNNVNNNPMAALSMKLKTYQVITIRFFSFDSENDQVINSSLINKVNIKKNKKTSCTCFVTLAIIQLILITLSI